MISRDKMKMLVSLKVHKRGMLCCVAIVCGNLWLGTALSADGSKKPNILLMMCDDMGWRDLSCFENDRVPTPNVDRLALEGVKLTQFYAASAVCTPTRASVLTGKYPLRFDIREHFHGKGEHLPISTSLPGLLKESGYSTAHIGKWHLGGLRVADFAIRDRSPGPIQHGFQHYLCQREEQPLRGIMLK